MSPLKLISALTTASALLMVAMPTIALANTAEQNQKLQQEVKVECTTGAYGQNSTCKATASQSGEQSQKIEGFMRNGRFIPVHKVANTGLDFMSMTALTGLLAAGSIAAVTKYKSKA